MLYFLVLKNHYSRSVVNFKRSCSIFICPLKILTHTVAYFFIYLLTKKLKEMWYFDRRKKKKPLQILLVSFPDPTYPEGKVHSAESSTVLAPLAGSLVSNTHCQLGSPNVSVHRPFALYWQM